jgi:anti-sigma regulatory factor (Ser/Thr protein kinase)
MIACTLTLDADGEISRAVADFVGALSMHAGLTPKQTYRLRLAVDEIATNVAIHGYGDDGWGVMDLEGGMDADNVWVRIEDDAPAFDPRSHDAAPRPASDPTEREVGGWGLFLAQSNVDEFRYDRVGGRNRNTLIIRRAAPPGDGADYTEGEVDARDVGTGRR